MFYHLNGTVAAIEPNLAVIECAGVGFALSATTNTLSHLKLGESAKLYTYEYIREDAFELYGFFDRREKRCFEMLLDVSGVGPKAALSILSATTPETLAMAIISGDERTLTAAPGVGKKIAQRILLELKDKMSRETGDMVLGGGAKGTAPVGNSKLSDAASALVVLGYSNAEISLVLKDIDTESMLLEDIIRLALKKMMK